MRMAANIMHAIDAKRAEVASGCISRQVEIDSIRIRTVLHLEETCSLFGSRRFAIVTAAVVVGRQRRMRHDTVSFRCTVSSLFVSSGNGFLIFQSIGDLACGMHRHSIGLE